MHWIIIRTFLIFASIASFLKASTQTATFHTDWSQGTSAAVVRLVSIKAYASQRHIKGYVAVTSTLDMMKFVIRFIVVFAVGET